MIIFKLTRCFTWGQVYLCALEFDQSIASGNYDMMLAQQVHLAMLHMPDELVSLLFFTLMYLPVVLYIGLI